MAFQEIFGQLSHLSSAAWHMGRTTPRNAADSMGCLPVHGTYATRPMFAIALGGACLDWGSLLRIAGLLAVTHLVSPPRRTPCPMHAGPPRGKYTAASSKRDFTFVTVERMEESLARVWRRDLLRWQRARSASLILSRWRPLAKPCGPFGPVASEAAFFEYP